MTASFLTILSALLAILPVVLNLLEQRKVDQRAKQAAIQRRDLDELESGMARVDGLSADRSLSPGGPSGV
jgi:hypothetical protein